MSEQAKSTTLIMLCSLNVNWSNAATHAAMYIIAESKDPVYDVLLVQEPWWEKINHEYRTVSFPGWQIILPKHPIQTTECPRVAAYQRINANLEVILCNDIISDLDVMALEWLHPPQQVTMGFPGIICQEKGWQPLPMH